MEANILAKYKVARDGWDVNRLSYRQSALWKGIISVKDRFVPHIRLKIESGRKIPFWQDVRLGDRSLVVQFLKLHRCARDGREKATDYMVRSSNNVVWTLSSEGIYFRQKRAICYPFYRCLEMSSTLKKAEILSSFASFFVASFATILSSNNSHSRQLDSL